MKTLALQAALLLKTLSALPCFTQVTKVTAIRGGLSHDCFKVEADNNYFFAKKITGDQRKNELILAKVAALNDLSPSVYYHDEQWVISHYIENENLAEKEIPLRDKITISIGLMMKFHQLSTSYPHQINTNVVNTLNIMDTIKDLFPPNNQLTLMAELIKYGREIEAFISEEMHNKTNNRVCCHSDINFSNILSGKISENKEDAWLIDFEYACFAPAEFDLAMFIAVNSIPKTLTNISINLYEQQAKVSVNKKLLNFYILFCHLINGLWYFNNSLDGKLNLMANVTANVTPDLTFKAQDKMRELAIEQWQAFDILYVHLKMSKNTVTLQKFI